MVARYVGLLGCLKHLTEHIQNLDIVEQRNISNLTKGNETKHDAILNDLLWHQIKNKHSLHNISAMKGVSQLLVVSFYRIDTSQLMLP